MAELAYELRSDGVVYDLDCGVKVRLQGKSATRVRVSMQQDNTIIPPETGDLGTSRFRDRLTKNAAEHFTEVEGLADELGLIAVAYGDHLKEREHAAEAASETSDEDDAPELKGTSYRIAGGGFVRLKRTQEGEIPERLTNFTAKIAADVAEDDGAEVRRSFEVEANLGGRRTTFTIPSSQFAGMGWATEHLGASAIIYPGSTIKDHARAAVQMYSGGVPTRHVYAHTGWRKVGDEWIYLHAGGAIGRVGQVEDTQVDLSGALAGRALPEPETSYAGLAADVRASLNLWKLAPESITAPLLAATYRAALGESDFSVHISGPTGEGKSELAALMQQHYGAGLGSRHLASWESTENAIEGQAFQAKDQVMVLDDFAPTGSSYDVQRWHKKADRVLRAKGNASARQRMRADTTLRPDKPPRALIFSTGEDIPRGQSLRARMMILELSPGELDFERLSRCQRDASSGACARAMAGFLRWLAPRYEEIQASLKEEHAKLRDAAGTSAQHRRTPGVVADLALGLRYFLLFAHEVGTLSVEQAEQGWLQGWAALGEAAASQGRHQAAGEPTRRFRELLSAAIASGRAHVASSDGSEPSTPGAWGWRESGDEHRPQGERVGWVDGEDLYLEPEAAFAAAQKQGRDSGEPLTVAGTTLRKRLHERGLLRATDEARQILTVRRTLGGSRKGVLHTAKDFLSISYTKPDQPDQQSEGVHRYADHAPYLWSGNGFETRPAPDHEPDQEPQADTDGRVTEEAWSGNGRAPNHEPDQQKADTYAENSGNGRVGRVSHSGGDRDNSGHAQQGALAEAKIGTRLTVSEALSEINTSGTGAALNAENYRKGELGQESAIEYTTKAILHRRGRDTGGWQHHAPAVRAALTHPLDCECGECL